MSPSDTAEGGERARTPDSGNPQVGPARSQNSVERVRLSNILLEDKTFQFRFSSPNKDLLASLGHERQREPIDLVGADPPYRIVDGFRRLSAARELGWDSIEAFVHRVIDNKEAMRIAFTKNVVRKNLSTLEKAHAIVLARKRGLKRAEIAEFFGLSERQVNRYLEYLKLPDDIQRICDDGGVTMAHAKILADFQVRDPEKWKKRIEEEKLDTRSLRKVLRQDRGGRLRGRPKSYFKQEKNRIRIYGCRISLNAPQEEKERAIGAFEEVIGLLRKGADDTLD